MTTEIEPVILRNVAFYDDDSDEYDSDLIEFLHSKSIWELRFIIKIGYQKRNIKIQKNFFDLSHLELQQIIIENGFM